MQWKDCAKRYKAYISLGSTCQTAHQLDRAGLRRFAGPLDWFVSDSAAGLIRLLENRFEGLMDKEHLHFTELTDTHFVVKDSVYDILSFHDFPITFPTERSLEVYPSFKEKLNRRVQRFMTTIQEGPILFIRSHTTKEEALELQTVLSELTPVKHDLLIVNRGKGRGMKEEDWGLDNIFPVTMPKGKDWRGCDRSWDRLTCGCAVSETIAK